MCIYIYIYVCVCVCVCVYVCVCIYIYIYIYIYVCVCVCVCVYETRALTGSTVNGISLLSTFPQNPPLLWLCEYLIWCSVSKPGGTFTDAIHAVRDERHTGIGTRARLPNYWQFKGSAVAVGSLARVVTTTLTCSIWTAATTRDKAGQTSIAHSIQFRAFKQRKGKVRSGQVRSEGLTCTFRARLSRAQVPTFAGSSVRYRFKRKGL